MNHGSNDNSFPKLSVIIPCYNEEEIIINTIKQTTTYLSQKPFPFEIIVVDDGSTDKTTALLQGAGGNTGVNPKVLQILQNKKNRGKGYSIRKGMLAAKGKYRLFMDADLSTPLSTIDEVLFLIRKYDVVIASRRIRGSKIKVAQPFHKTLLGTIGSHLIELVIEGIKDTQCGFKIFRKEIVETIFPRLEIDRWAIDVEVLAAISVNGFSIVQHPVCWSNTRKSSVKLKDYFLFLRDLYRVKSNLKQQKYLLDQQSITQTCGS